MFAKTGHQLISLLVSLAWKDVVILHDSQFDTAFLQMLESHRITLAEYDITSLDVDLFEVFNDLETMYSSTVNIMLFCNASITEVVLKKMDEHDRITNFMDLRHASRLLLIEEEETVTVCSQYKSTEVENIAIISLSYLKNMTITIETLLFQPGGRVFAQVETTQWPNMQLDALFPNIKYGYNGRKISAVMKNQRQLTGGFVRIGNNTVSEFNYRVLDNLCKALNLSYQIVFSHDDVYGKNNNGSWTGIIGMLQRREADVVPEILAVIPARIEAIDFIFPAVTETGSWVTYRKENPDDNVFIFTRPFRSSVYLACLASLFAVCVLQVCIRYSNTHNKNKCASEEISGGTALCYNCHKRPGKIIVIEAFFDSFGSMLKQGIVSNASQTSSRLLLASWLIFSVLISSIYSCSILAALTVEDDGKPFNNPTELVQRTDYKIGYAESTATGSVIRGSRNPVIVALRERVADLSSGDKDILSDDFATHKQRVTEGKYALISGLSIALPMVESNCELETFNTKFGASYASFGIQKNSPYNTDFALTMYQLQENGILAKLHKEWVSSLSNETCPRKEFPRPVSTSKFLTIFYSVAIGCTSALTVLILEIVCGSFACR